MRVLVASLMTSFVLGACGGSSPDCAGDGPITGIVLDVESRTLTDVRAFTLRSGDRECEILVDPDRDYGFPLPHLNEHKISADPVRVEVEVRDDELVAISIDDTPTP